MNLFLSRYSLGSLIGQGSFANIHTCWLKDSPQHKKACKIVNKKKWSSGIPIQNEHLFLSKLPNCPHVVEFHDSFQDDQYIIMVMKYYEYGDLMEYIVHPDTRMTIQTFFGIATQLSDILLYFEKYGIIHHDIKLENIMIDSLLPFSVSLGDFGQAETQTQKSPNKKVPLVGTLEYMSPEKLKSRGEAQSFSFSSAASDVWSFGIVLYTILFKTFPHFSNGSFVRPTHPKINAWGFSIQHQDLVMDMIHEILTENPAIRITPQQIKIMLEGIEKRMN